MYKRNLRLLWLSAGTLRNVACWDPQGEDQLLCRRAVRRTRLCSSRPRGPRRRRPGRRARAGRAGRRPRDARHQRRRQRQLGRASSCERDRAPLPVHDEPLELRQHALHVSPPSLHHLDIFVRTPDRSEGGRARQPEATQIICLLWTCFCPFCYSFLILFSYGTVRNKNTAKETHLS